MYPCFDNRVDRVRKSALTVFRILYVNLMFVSITNMFTFLLVSVKELQCSQVLLEQQKQSLNDRLVAACKSTKFYLEGFSLLTCSSQFELKVFCVLEEEHGSTIT